MKEAFTKESAAKNNIQVTCPHCGKTGNKPTMLRWHFDNCKKSPKVARYSESDKSNDPFFNPFKEGTWWHEYFHDTYIKKLLGK